eukprot:1897005-Amphidinium_carterae.1
MKGLDYYGNVVTKPHKLTLEQMLPALPRENLGGSVVATDLANGYIKEVLLNRRSSSYLVNNGEIFRRHVYMHHGKSGSVLAKNSYGATYVNP